MNKQTTYTDDELRYLRQIVDRIRDLATDGDDGSLGLIYELADELMGEIKNPDDEKGGEMEKEYDIYINVINLDNEDRLHIVHTTDISTNGINDLVESYLDDEASGDDVDTTCKWTLDYILDMKGNVVDNNEATDETTPSKEVWVLTETQNDEKTVLAVFDNFDLALNTKNKLEDEHNLQYDIERFEVNYW